MVRNYLTRALMAAVAVGAVTSAAHAGGFSRGDADTEILYEDGWFAARGGVTFIVPKRGYETITGPNGTEAGTDADFSQNFGIPSIAMKARVSEAFSCALTYTQPFGAKTAYGDQAQAADRYADVNSPGYAFGSYGNAVKSSKFTTNEYGATCAVNFDAGPGDLYLIGGGFMQSFEYTEKKDFGTLNLKDSEAPGYRIGAAYEIKEYALRAELMYRSEVTQKTSGTFAPTALLTGLFYAATSGAVTLPSSNYAYATGALPQSIELNLQSGIAPGWLAFGSVKWTDWSVLDTLDYTIPVLGAYGNLSKNFFWKDGWTITGGVGHTFSDTVSGALSLTWDRGVGTGADIVTDTWTVGVGAQIKGGPGVLRVGAGISYLTEGSQSTANGADFNATAGNDWAYAVNASYKVAF